MESIAAVLGFQSALMDQAIGLAQLGSLQKGVRKTLALMIEDTENASGIEFGHTEERKIYVRALPGK